MGQLLELAVLHILAEPGQLLINAPGGLLYIDAAVPDRGDMDVHVGLELVDRLIQIVNCVGNF